MIAWTDCKVCGIVMLMSFGFWCEPCVCPHCQRWALLYGAV